MHTVAHLLHVMFAAISFPKVFAMSVVDCHRDCCKDAVRPEVRYAVAPQADPVALMQVYVLEDLPKTSNGKQPASFDNPRRYDYPDTRCRTSAAPSEATNRANAEPAARVSNLRHFVGPDW